MTDTLATVTPLGPRLADPPDPVALALENLDQAHRYTPRTDQGRKVHRLAVDQLARYLNEREAHQ